MDCYLPAIKLKFGQVWGGHRCDKPGCGWCVIGDGGLKAHRSLCAAVYSGVKEYPSSGVSIMTGPTQLVNLSKVNIVFNKVVQDTLDLHCSAKNTKIIHPQLCTTSR